MGKDFKKAVTTFNTSGGSSKAFQGSKILSQHYESQIRRST
ncbi:MAG: hypothetical protein ACLP29_11445 [Dissulfurispiraceae bacterium]